MLITDDGRYNRAALMLLAQKNWVLLRAAAPLRPHGREIWRDALIKAWARAHAEMTRYNVAHRLNLTVVPEHAARELARD